MSLAGDKCFEHIATATFFDKAVGQFIKFVVNIINTRSTYLAISASTVNRPSH